MNILIVSQYFYPEDFKINDIAFEMQKRGHNVIVLTGKPNYPYGKFFEGYSFLKVRKEIINGVKIIRCPIIPRGKSSGIMLGLNYFSFVFFGFIAVLFRLRGKFDAIFVNCLSPITVALPAIFAKKKFRCSMYLWVLDLWPESVSAAGGISNKYILSLLTSLVKFIYSKSDKILISSEGFEYPIRKIIGNNKDIVYFPNWAEEVFESNKINLSEVPSFPKGFNILFAGNLGEAQGLDVVMEAAGNCEEGINWLFVGDGRRKSFIEKKKNDFNLKNVYIYGRYPLQTMPSFFSQADVMLISLKNEALFDITVPAKIQAYLAVGKPILGIVGEATRNLIEKAKVGYSCQPDDSINLAELAKKISDDSERIEVFKENALKYYKKCFMKQTLMNKLENEIFRK